MQLALIAAAVACIVVFAWASITYVYRDAQRRGVDGDQWAGVLALSAGFGIVLYLLKRPALEEVEDPEGEY